MSDQQPSKTPSVVIDGTVQEIIDLRMRIGLAPWANLEQKALALETELSAANAEVERLKAEHNELEEKLRDAIIECGGNDPSDSDDATAESVIDELVGIHKRDGEQRDALLANSKALADSVERELSWWNKDGPECQCGQCSPCGLKASLAAHNKLMEQFK